ncbi:MAG: UDP-N-acetylmuramate--L-alanine ligase [Ruminococcaceae bacterium]|nr:UDP-N-acetylmuramate--L-alanine ligase [Oscillospiraceae bacterium]
MSLPNTDFGVEKIKAILQSARGVWFLGIGGVSVSALAEATLGLGVRVGGDDRTDSERIRNLQKKGAEIRIASSEPIPEGYGLVVYTVAISAENPQYLDAQIKGIPCVSRADYLGYLISAFEVRIGVAGMHGKSTCTAMCAQILTAAGDPTIFAGADLPALNGDCCRIGSEKQTVLFESCEYMDSFLHFSPNIAVVLNIGMDHVDYFHSMEQIRSSFRKFADRAENGTLLWNFDDPESQHTFSGRKNAKTFSVRDPSADFFANEIQIERGEIRFLFSEKGKEPFPVHLRAVGLHSVYNALAAAAAASLSGISAESIAGALEEYRGAARRTEFKGYYLECPVYDDYAHHPDEIKATLEGIRKLVPEGGRLVCVYQPHTYSRTAGFFHAFSESFDQADLLLLSDIYAARERNQSGVCSEQLAKAIRRRGGRVLSTGSVSETAEILTSFLKKGDLLVVMGAGDIESIFNLLPLEKTEKDK